MKEFFPGSLSQWHQQSIRKQGESKSPNKRPLVSSWSPGKLSSKEMLFQQMLFHIGWPGIVVVFKYCPAGLGQFGVVVRNLTLEPHVTPIGESAGTPDLCICKVSHSLHGRMVREVKERSGEPLLQHPLSTIGVSASLGMQGATTRAPLCL